jgi:alpha-D-xyloside xylohydrolase
LLEKRFGKNGAVVFARSATVGGQKFPVHWGGDNNATFESMAESLRGGLSLGMSGFGFWSHDIGGFENIAAPALYKRWVAFGLLSSHSRLHGSGSSRVPWQFDDESVDVLRFFTRQKCQLMPYLYQAAIAAATVGTPVMRSMFLSFPADPGCRYLDRQYMLGPSLLIAPVLSEKDEVEYYLPPGRWTNFLTDETAAGGTWRRETHGFLSIPMWVKENTLLPIGANAERPDYEYAHDLTLHVFNVREGADLHVDVPDVQGKTAASFHCVRTGKTLRITRQGSAGSWSVCLRGVDAKPAVSTQSNEITIEL